MNLHNKIMQMAAKREFMGNNAACENERLRPLIEALAKVAEAAENVDSVAMLIKKSNGQNSNLLFDLDDAHKALDMALSSLAGTVGDSPEKELK